MSRNLFRIARFAALSILVLVVIYKLSTQPFDVSKFKGQASAPLQGTTGGFVTKPDAAVSAGDAAGHSLVSNKDGLTSSHAAAVETGPDYKRENATFVTLARNSDLWGLVDSIRSVEDRFNRKFKYDWVFLNNEEFDDNFKKVVTALVSGNTYFGLIPAEQWSYPAYIDQEKARECRKKLASQGVIYGDNESYRHMCRYESGFFWRHPLMNNYRYYWRVEPDIKIFCDVDYDIFKFMSENNKSYGFTISLKEYPATIETLWETTKKFLAANPNYLHPNSAKAFITDENMSEYNLCHFWSNFEVADMDLWRSEAYRAYFEYLDQAGGFFYERWGDAPVHSIAAALFVDKSTLHHFEDVGYFHNPFTQCPTVESERLKRRCSCNTNDNFSWDGYSCTAEFYTALGLQKPDGWLTNHH